MVGVPTVCKVVAIWSVQECEAVLDVLRQQEQDHLASVPPSQRHRIKESQVCHQTLAAASVLRFGWAVVFNVDSPHVTLPKVDCEEL